jgi:hypothetical protein
MIGRPLASLTDDEKFVITTLYARHQVCRFAGLGPGAALSVADVQRLTPWPGSRPMGKARVSAALRSLTDHGLAIRTRPDVYRYRLDERGWVAWGGRESTPAGGGS